MGTLNGILGWREEVNGDRQIQTKSGVWSTVRHACQFLVLTDELWKCSRVNDEIGGQEVSRNSLLGAKTTPKQKFSLKKKIRCNRMKGPTALTLGWSQQTVKDKPEAESGGAGVTQEPWGEVFWSPSSNIGSCPFLKKFLFLKKLLKIKIIGTS